MAAELNFMGPCCMQVKNIKIAEAVVREDGSKIQKLMDKAFAAAFKGLVYAQIWEDPVVDMAALQIHEKCRIATIASGGCNVLSYLTANPAQIVAVDLNTAHVALGKLKIAAATHLPDYAHFRRFFADADSKLNLKAYDAFIRPHLDDVSRAYWEGRDLVGRKRIGAFSSGVYRRGLLGGFIGTAHLLAKLYGIKPQWLLEASSLEEQRLIFENKLAPIFERKFIRWLTDQPASLFGLGIPPAQFTALAGDSKMADVLRQRLEKLACDFDIQQNYFAWQAFGRGYSKDEHAPLPPYLQAQHYAKIQERIDRVDFRHQNMTDMLGQSNAASFDRYLLLDAQDWMTDEQLNALWAEITRTARTGARVVFRTAAQESLLPGRLSNSLLLRWDYKAEESLEFTRNDRSSIYGGVHLYVLK